MKYSKEVFLSNLEHLTLYGAEPELTIHLKNNKCVFIVAYKDSIDFTNDLGETKKLNKAEDVLTLIDFDDIFEIESDIDFAFSVESQSVIVDGKLWLDSVSPKQVMRKYKRQAAILKDICLVCDIMAFICCLIVVLMHDFFDFAVIIACSVLFGFVAISMILLAVYDIKRNKILDKYYGKVSDADAQKAKDLLNKIRVVENNTYDFCAVGDCDIDASYISSILKRLMKGKKIFADLVEPIQKAEQELLMDTRNEQYNDMAFNEYIFDLVRLIENNLSDI